MYRLRAQKFKDREKLLGDEKEKLEVRNLPALLVQNFKYWRRRRYKRDKSTLVRELNRSQEQLCFNYTTYLLYWYKSTITDTAGATRGRRARLFANSSDLKISSVLSTTPSPSFTSATCCYTCWARVAFLRCAPPCFFFSYYYMCPLTMTYASSCYYICATCCCTCWRRAASLWGVPRLLRQYLYLFTSKASTFVPVKQATCCYTCWGRAVFLMCATSPFFSILLCVLILLHKCPHTTTCVLIHYMVRLSSCYYMCPHTSIYVSSYYYIYVLMPFLMCPHTAMY